MMRNSNAGAAHCLFCRIVEGQLPSSRVVEDEHCIALMDAFPLRPGHVLVIPRRHAETLTDLTPELRAHLLETAQGIAQALRRSPLAPDGIHFAINEGRAAHQTVPHCHIHVLPRRRGDLAGLLGQILSKPIQLLRGPRRQDERETQARLIAQYLEF
ncbi:HIT family protein [Candidatus Macondimonas diazotrophica]|jgi:histidine triad (HIT) family protein|nr:HIT family protein [Candidatus Macondimonas diazotrophica]